MRNVSVSEAKNNLSALLREVSGGQTIIITDRGQPVARLSAPQSIRGVSAAAVELAQRGRLRLPNQSPSARWLTEAPAAPKTKSSAVRALLDERESSR